MKQTVCIEATRVFEDIDVRVFEDEASEEAE